MTRFVHLKFSRRRLLEAGDTERRLLEQRLRTGPVRRLDQLGTIVDALINGWTDDPAALARLRRCTEQLAHVRVELDGICRGLDPVLLADGLAPALRDLAEQSPVPVTVELTDVLPGRQRWRHLVLRCFRGPGQVIRHARATRATLRLGSTDDDIVLDVEDDGVGGADLGSRYGPSRAPGPTRGTWRVTEDRRLPYWRNLARRQRADSNCGNCRSRMTATIVRLGLVVSGIVVVAAATLTMLVPPRAAVGASRATFGQVHWAIAMLIVIAAAALVTAGGAAWFSRPRTLLAIIAIWAAAAWLAPELLGSPAVPREFRSVARLLVPMVTPLVAAHRGDRGSGRLEFAEPAVSCWR